MASEGSKGFAGSLGVNAAALFSPIKNALPTESVLLIKAPITPKDPA
jgi:hypothetical protein